MINCAIFIVVNCNKLIILAIKYVNDKKVIRKQKKPIKINKNYKNLINR